MDRLSELPEPLILHILSFLDMTYVVNTATLSKRWEHLWTIAEELEFDDSYFLVNDSFVNFVNRTLFGHQTSKIRKLRICLFINAVSSIDYDGWILYASRNNVEELFLDFSAEGCYWSPLRCLYRNSSLKTLRLSNCEFTPALQISWNSLTKLTLHLSVVRDTDINNIMIGAPKLEYFELDYCCGYNDLNCDSLSLRTLTVLDVKSGEEDHFLDGHVMRISAPNIQSLFLSGSFYRRCILMNLQSIVHATLNFDGGYEKLKWEQDNLMELVGSLKHVQNLTLSAWCIEVLALRELSCVPSPISNHKCLTLSQRMKEDDLSWTVSLLKGSPDLQKLIINMQSELILRFPKGTKLVGSDDFQDSEGANCLALPAEHITCLLHHLKTVKIAQFVPQNAVLPFLEFILKNGKVLENLIIIAKRADVNSQKSLKAAERLHNVPRASSRAVITLI